MRDLQIYRRLRLAADDDLEIPGAQHGWIGEAAAIEWGFRIPQEPTHARRDCADGLATAPNSRHIRPMFRELLVTLGLFVVTALAEIIGC
jgi:hypothetical protein